MARPITGTNIERFWRRTKIVGRCIEATGWRDKDGYGRFAVCLKRRRKGRAKYRTVIAHRWIYATVIGAIPRGKVVMHSCDRPACVALQHLSIGTQKQNQEDSCAKGRHISGEAHFAAKLTWEAVNQIRASKESHAALGRKFGVTRSAIWRVRSGRAWRGDNS